jgi:hypothetical protein
MTPDAIGEGVIELADPDAGGTDHTPQTPLLQAFSEFSS